MTKSQMANAHEALACAHADIEDLRARLARNGHAPGSIYLSEEVAELERDKLFLTHWLCVGRVEEFAAPGDYQTLTIAGEPIVVARTREGTLAAYKNRCLHRGVEVAYGEGNASRFTCPYHAWTYDLAGQLVVAPAVERAELNLPSNCLPQLRIAEWRGWVFVNFDANAQSFEQFIAPYEDTLWYYGAGECRMAFKTVFDIECNWKFIAENLLDFYHARTIHAATFGTQYKLKDNTLPFTPIADGGVSFVFGSDTRKNTPNMFPTLGWLGRDPDFQAGKGAIFPNINLFVNTDSVRSWTLWPGETPGRMKAIFYFLLPKDSFDVPDFQAKLDSYRTLVAKIADEDKPALLSLQRAVASPNSYDPGPVTHFEIGIRHLLSHYADVLKA